MKVLVTGGAGFIGSHLCEALLAQGDTVISLDDLSTGSAKNLESIKSNPKFTSVTGSILDEALIEKLINSEDGTQQRVFGHVSDAIAGILSLWNSDKGHGEAFNLGGFEETTINELAKEIISLTQSSSTIEYQSYSDLAKEGFEDLAHRIPDTSKLTQTTGWKAKKDLTTILNEAHQSLIS